MLPHNTRPLPPAVLTCPYVAQNLSDARFVARLILVTLDGERDKAVQHT